MRLLLVMAVMVVLCSSIRLDLLENDVITLVEEVCFKDCIMVESKGKLLPCGKGETAVKCQATRSDCGASQVYNGQGCKMNSCAFGKKIGLGGKIQAICCKETFTIGEVKKLGNDGSDSPYNPAGK
mgnify:FL=1